MLFTLLSLRNVILSDRGWIFRLDLPLNKHSLLHQRITQLKCTILQEKKTKSHKPNHPPVSPNATPAGLLRWGCVPRRERVRVGIQGACRLPTHIQTLTVFASDRSAGWGATKQSGNASQSGCRSSDVLTLRTPSHLRIKRNWKATELSRTQATSSNPQVPVSRTESDPLAGCQDGSCDHPLIRKGWQPI